MKKHITTTILLAMFTTCSTMIAGTHQEEYLGLPGDNLNLYAVMKLFQESETLESFERNLNNENTRINNLDLNGDNLIDYIRVRDYVDGDVHNIVLQVAVNRKETQDVAVFTVQRFRNGQVQIQLIGDEALYGRNYIIEPIYDEQYADQTPNPGYIGNSGNITVVRTTYYEVAEWPVIRFLFMPGYVAWYSDWYWGYYPSYWHPWRPYYWHFYYGYHYNWYHDYYSHYRHCDHYRYDHWNDFYYSHRRSYSPYVSHRIESGHYKATYSHPDQRRQGEELYARSNHDQGNRRTDQYQGKTTARRSDYQADQTRQQKGNNFSTTRRTNTDVNRSATEMVRTNNSGSERRSTPVVSSRSAAPQTSSYNTFSERKASAARVDKSVANPKPAQSFASNKPTSKPAKGGESFSSRRSSGNSQSVKSSGGSENKKSAEKSKSTGRR